MAHIQNISFSKVGKLEGCKCDRCGQYIQRIWTVKFTEGQVINFGIDCFEKMQKDSKLNDYGQKAMKKVLKKVESYQEMKQFWESATEETEAAMIKFTAAKEGNHLTESFWSDKTFDDYKKWMLEKCIPESFKDCQKEIDRFQKINFKLEEN